MAKHIKVLRRGRWIVFDPTTEPLKGMLLPLLTFTKKTFLYGIARQRAIEAGGSIIQLEDHQCYSFDHRERLACAYGFYPRLRKFLRAQGYELELVDLKPHAKPEIFVPNWNAVLELGKLRHRQREFLELITKRDQGRFDCCTGYGKTHLIALSARMLNKARIHVVSKSADVCRNIYSELAGVLPDVGIVGAGNKKFGHRVMVFVAKSLGHSDGQADILFCDESHELGTDSFVEHLVRYKYARSFGLSATHDMRLDNQDMRLEALFGPIIMKIGYEEGRKHGLVVPIKVRWTDVHMDVDPADGLSGVIKNRWGVWRNKYRNSLIAKDARKYDQDTQVLIVVNTIDHAVHLKKLLPEFKLVYAENGMDAEHRRKYIDWGLISEDMPLMTMARRIKLRKLFERGKLKKVIATSVWNVGVDFKRLPVLIRADASGSPIRDTQIPGRLSRISAATGKSQGILHDYRDQFNRGMQQKAKRREKNYHEHGWEQTGTTKSLFDNVP